MKDQKNKQCRFVFLQLPLLTFTMGLKGTVAYTTKEFTHKRFSTHNRSNRLITIFLFVQLLSAKCDQKFDMF